jgi:hypothetical protein
MKLFWKILIPLTIYPLFMLLGPLGFALWVLTIVALHTQTPDPYRPFVLEQASREQARQEAMQTQRALLAQARPPRPGGNYQ